MGRLVRKGVYGETILVLIRDVDAGCLLVVMFHFFHDEQRLKLCAMLFW